MDVSIYHSSSDNLNRLLDTQAVSLGFEYIFSNLLLTTKSQDMESQISTFITKTRSRTGSLPLQSRQRDTLCVFARVTLALQHGDRVSVLKDSLLPKLRAVDEIECLCIRPATEAQFFDLLAVPDLYDMLSIDLSQGSIFQNTYQTVKTVKAQDDVVIEIEVSSTLRGSTELMNLITGARHVLAKTGGVLVSSGAKNAFEMKSPLDLVNWGEGILKLRGCKAVVNRILEKTKRRRIMISNLVR